MSTWFSRQVHALQQNPIWHPTANLEGYPGLTYRDAFTRMSDNDEPFV